jgi:hypothetical protein
MIKRIAVLSVAAAVAMTFAVAGRAEAAPSSIGAKVHVAADWGVGVGVSWPSRAYRRTPTYVTYEQRPIYGTVVVGYDVYGRPMYGTGVVGWQTVPVVHEGYSSYRTGPTVSLGLGLGFGGGHRHRHRHHHH